MGNQDDKMNLDTEVSEDENALLVSLLDLVREGHFSFVYDNFNKTEMSSENIQCGCKWHMEGHCRKLKNEQYEIPKQCIVKLNKLPDSIVQKELNSINNKPLRGCYVSLCRIRNLELSKLLCKTDKTDDEIRSLYILTKDDTWECKLCKLEIRSESKIIEHWNVHSLLNPLRCKTCAKTNFRHSNVRKKD